MNENLKRVGVIGSWRTYENNENYRRYYNKDEFSLTCEKIGEILADHNLSLYVAWSNDFHDRQVLKKEYYFEETAEYHVLNGYMWKDGRKQPNILPEIYLSDFCFKVFQLATKIHKNKVIFSENEWVLLNNELIVKGNPLNYVNSLSFLSIEDKNFILELKNMQKGDYDGLSYLAYLVNSDLKIITKIVDDTKIYAHTHMGDFSKTSLRSEITENVILPEIDLLITIGGGKVTEIALKYAISHQLPCIPIFSFGGVTDTFFSGNIIKNHVDQIRDPNTKKRIKKYTETLLELLQNNVKLEEINIEKLNQVLIELDDLNYPKELDPRIYPFLIAGLLFLRVGNLASDLHSLGNFIGLDQ